ncbi:hypothetical protein NLI96_g11215 [Meripilus lineatus]|uniref:Zona occludens toxin N-terminal domain-containing protein n=1 Tax=Meripilus lineatus TaxID=2056292 RepID=A0AAD5YDH4_9APHY|nr:hypothetical protein NLI96_g11215 [Physisporinus lineatus]
MSSHRSSTRGTFSRSSSVKTKVGSASILQGDPQENELIDLSAVNSGPALEHERKTAPLFTRAAYIALGGRTTFPARGLLGAKLDDSGIQSWQAEPPKSEDSDSRLYNAPFSAVICGVQGSGKSHTAAVLLENMLIRKHDKIGTLRKPLSGLVLHFGEGGPSSLPSEAAWVGVPNDPTTKAPEIQVFVSKSSFSTMGKVYEKLGLKGLVVRPLLFTEAELDAQAFLTMMAIWSKEMTPLYVQVILSLLRELGEEFTYQAFLDRLRAKKRELQATQLNALKQRLDLLDAFVDKESTNRQKRYAPGRLTIIDLSDPFIDATSACSIFEILTRQFAREDVGTGKVLLVDEAHKYLQVASTNALSGLTKELSSLIRQQRHLAMRVLISTQGMLSALSRLNATHSQLTSFRADCHSFRSA